MQEEMQELLGECYGYDYKASDYKCEVWIVPINEHKLEYRNGVDCYIKKGYNDHKVVLSLPSRALRNLPGSMNHIAIDSDSLMIDPGELRESATCLRGIPMRHANILCVLSATRSKP